MDAIAQDYMTSLLLKHVPDMHLRCSAGGWPDENEVKIHILSLEGKKIRFQIFFKCVQPNCCFGDTQSTELNTYSAVINDEKIENFISED